MRCLRVLRLSVLMLATGFLCLGPTLTVADEPVNTLKGEIRVQLPLSPDVRDAVVLELQDGWPGEPEFQMLLHGQAHIIRWQVPWDERQWIATMDRLEALGFVLGKCDDLNECWDAAKADCPKLYPNCSTVKSVSRLDTKKGNTAGCKAECQCSTIYGTQGTVSYMCVAVPPPKSPRV